MVDDDDGPGGHPPPQPRCAICGKYMSECTGHEDAPPPQGG